MKHQHKPFIFCVDDDADDLVMLREAFAATGCNYPVEVAYNGEEALRQLTDMSLAADLPCLIVLDINMPRVDGRETLLAILKDERFAGVPVVAFSTSSSPLDKMFFSRYNVAFFTKPCYYNELETVAATMLHHCRNTAAA